MNREHDAWLERILVEPDVADVVLRDDVAADVEGTVLPHDDVLRRRSEATADGARDQEGKEHERRDEVQRHEDARDDDERRRRVRPDRPPLDLDVERQLFTMGGVAPPNLSLVLAQKTSLIRLFSVSMTLRRAKFLSFASTTVQGA